MHSRLTAIWRNQFPSFIHNVFKQCPRNLTSQLRPLQCINNNVSLHLYSTDSPKDNIDLNEEIKLEDINIEISNPAVENIDYDAITNGDHEVLSRLKFLVLETDSFFQDGSNVPTRISTEDWKHMLTLPSRSQRQKFLNFLFKKEMIKANEKARKEAKQIEGIEMKAQALEERQKITHIYYGLQGNTLFQRLYDTYMNKIDNHRAMQSIQLGPDIIIDMDYYHYMNRMEMSTLGKQLLYIISDNRILWEPYNIIFSSYRKDNHVAQKLESFIPNIYTDDFPFNYTHKHFTELGIDRSELVYLTPHTNDVLMEHKPGSVYIIGGMVDKRISQPLSLAKAKKENIRAAKLPLDYFLDWGNGHKSLTLNQIMAIMNDWRITNDWKYSFRHVPKRKLYQAYLDERPLKTSENGYRRAEGPGDISAKYIRERKKRQLVYDLLLKR